MPNWCMNDLTVNSENTEDLKKFVDENKEILKKEDAEQTDPEVTPQDLSFERSVPLGDWEYNRAVDEWGCKWDASDVELDYSEDSTTAVYHFSTPWAPPVDWLKKVGKKYPDLIFSLHSEEPGCDFVLDMEIEYGELTKEEFQELTKYYFEKNEYQNLYEKCVQLLIKEHIDYIKNSLYNKKDKYDTFSLSDLMDDEDIIKSEELTEVWEESQDYPCSWIFENYVNDYINDKLVVILDRIKKFMKKLKYRKIVHKNKFNNTKELIEKVAYLPNLLDSNNEYFVNNKVPIVLKDGGVVFKEILENI